MGVDENGLNRARCAKLGCFCHKYSGKKAESKKEKKTRGQYYCRECLHSPIDHVVVSEGITNDIPTPTKPDISTVTIDTSGSTKQAEKYIPNKSPQTQLPAQHSSSYSNSSIGQASNVSAPNPRGNVINEHQVNAFQPQRDKNQYSNRPDGQFGNLTENVRVESMMNRNSNLSGNNTGNGGNNRGNSNLSRGNSSNRGMHSNSRGSNSNLNTRGNMNRGNLNSRGSNSNLSNTQASKSPFGNAFAPRVPSMAPSALGVQDRGNYDDSHIRDCDKVSRIGRNVGLMGPDKYVLSHIDAKYYESSKQTPTNSNSSLNPSSSISPNRMAPNQSNPSPSRNRPPMGGNTQVRGNPRGGAGGNSRGASPRNPSPAQRNGNGNSGGRSNTPSKQQDDSNCCVCRQEMYGSYMILGNHSYHKHCASCNDCRQNVFRQPFFQLPQSHYLSCESCYERKV